MFLGVCARWWKAAVVLGVESEPAPMSMRRVVDCSGGVGHKE
jgi:hypothetical protein